MQHLSQNEWKEYNSKDAGYLQKINKAPLLKILTKHELRIRIVQNFGYHHVQGSPLFLLDKEVKEEKILNVILSTFIFYPGERIQDHTFYGFRQLSEIAVKALSPGINEPGTANICVDYLTDLFTFKIGNDYPNIIFDKNNTPRILMQGYSFNDLFNMCMIPILNYGNKDISTLAALLGSLKKLAKKDREKIHQQDLTIFLNAVLKQIEKQKETEYFIFTPTCKRRSYH